MDNENERYSDSHLIADMNGVIDCLDRLKRQASPVMSKPELETTELLLMWIALELRSANKKLYRID